MSTFGDSSTFHLIPKCSPEQPGFQGFFREKAVLIFRGKLFHRREIITEKTQEFSQEFLKETQNSACFWRYFLNWKALMCLVLIGWSDSID